MDMPDLPPLPALQAATERVEVWGLMQDYAKAYASECIRLAVAEQREKDAALCEAKSKEWIACGPTVNWEYRAHGAEECAAAIRGEAK